MIIKKLFLSVSIVLLLTSFTSKPIVWVAVGDSITYLNDHLDETGNRVTKGYMTRVVEQLPDIQYINQGHNGWTAGGIAEQFDKLGVVKADVYSVFLGTNDWWQGRPIGKFSDYQNHTGNSTIYGSFRIIVDKLKSLNASAKIILITPMQRTDFVYLTDMHNNAWGCYKEKNHQTLAQVAKAIDSITRYEHFALVDLYNKSGITVSNAVKYKRLKDPQTGAYKNYRYPEYIDIPFNPDTDEYPYPIDAIDMTYDGLHPSDKGDAVIANMLVKVLKKN
jgi:lysophospholipase L1-like esterase